MAAGEDQAKTIVRLGRSRVCEERELFAIAGIAVQAIEGEAPGDRPQPGSRPVRNAVACPALQADQEGILHDLLRHAEVTKDPGEGGSEPTRLLSKDHADGGLAVA